MSLKSTNIRKTPGRHIISEIDSLFSRLGKYLDQYLQPLVPYLKDSRQLISELKHLEKEEGKLLVTIDVNSYTNNVQKKQPKQCEMGTTETQ